MPSGHFLVEHFWCFVGANVNNFFSYPQKNRQKNAFRVGFNF